MLNHSPPKRISTIILADDAILRRSLVWMLQDPQIDIVALCTVDDRGVQAIATKHPEIIVIEVRYGSKSQIGLEFITRTLTNYPDIRCIGLTSSFLEGEQPPMAFLAKMDKIDMKLQFYPFAINNLPQTVIRLGEGKLT